MADNLAGTSELPREKTFESFRVAAAPDGWITPAGVFYSCTPEEHDLCAKYLLKTQEKVIKSRLIENENNGIYFDPEGHSPREVLKAAGYALLSDNLLSEVNLPESLTLKQMELIDRSKLAFTPQSGKLDLKTYQDFGERLKSGENVGLSHNRVFNTFLEDPTGNIYIADNTEFSKKVFDALTIGYSDEIRLQLLKEKIVWRRIKLPSGDVYVQFERHDHTSGGAYTDVFPEMEDYIVLTNKEGVKKFIEKSKYQQRLDGDIEILD